MSKHVDLELFRGREGENNERIAGLLSRESLTAYQIAKRLDKTYSTIFDRLRDLEHRGIIEKKGETEAAKSHSKIPLWGLSAYGVYVIIQSPNPQIRTWALIECQRRLLESWDAFWELYEFDLVKDRRLRHRFERNWIASEAGMMEILRFFGHTLLIGEPQALLTFRRMLDLGIILVQSQGDFVLAKLGDLPFGGDFVDALTMLGGLAIDHPRLRKLHDAIREVDGPLYSRIKSQAFDKMVALLSKSVPTPIARKLAMTPLFRDYPLALMDMTENHFVESPIDEVIRTAVGQVREAVEWNRKAQGITMTTTDGKKLSIRGVFQPSLQKVVLEKNYLSIVTTDPGVISKEWLRHSGAIYIIDRKGRVRTGPKGAKLEAMA